MIDEIVKTSIENLSKGRSVKITRYETTYIVESEGLGMKEVCEFTEPEMIERLCVEAYETAIQKGWHDSERENGTVLALIHSEVSEALEADRKGNEENFVEELADVCIRVFDLCGSKDLDLQGAIERKMKKNKERSYRHGNKRY